MGSGIHTKAHRRRLATTTQSVAKTYASDDPARTRRCNNNELNDQAMGRHLAQLQIRTRAQPDKDWYKCDWTKRRPRPSLKIFKVQVDRRAETRRIGASRRISTHCPQCTTSQAGHCPVFTFRDATQIERLLRMCSRPFLRAGAGQRTDPLFILGEFGGEARIDHFAVVEHIGAVGDLDRRPHVLFD
jgi:hypothetical protein